MLHAVEIRRVCFFLNPLHAPRCGGKQIYKHGCSHDRFAKRMFMQQMASDIFVRILRGMGACRKKPAQPASGTLSWMTPSETLLRLCLGGFGDMKWAWGGGWRLPAFLCQTTSSPGFCPISRAHFRDRKTLRKRVHHKGPPLKSTQNRFRRKRRMNETTQTPKRPKMLPHKRRRSL